MSPEKKSALHLFWHPYSFDLYIVILTPGTNDISFPDRLKKINPAGQHSELKPQSMTVFSSIVSAYLSSYSLMLIGHVFYIKKDSLLFHTRVKVIKNNAMMINMI